MFGGKISSKGVYLLRSNNSYTAVSQSVFVNLTRFEVITYSVFSFYVVIYGLFWLFFRQSANKMYADIDELIESVTFLRKFKEADHDKIGCYCVIVFFIAIIIYLSLYAYYKSQPEGISPVVNLDSKPSNKGPNKRPAKIYADQSDFFPEQSEMENEELDDDIEKSGKFKSE